MLESFQSLNDSDEKVVAAIWATGDDPSHPLAGGIVD